MEIQYFANKPEVPLCLNIDYRLYQYLIRSICGVCILDSINNSLPMKSLFFLTSLKTSTKRYYFRFGFPDLVAKVTAAL